MTQEEAILEGRRRNSAGEFKRRIVKRKPANLLSDAVELECGHSSTAYSERDTTTCLQCFDEWVAQATQEQPK